MESLDQNPEQNKHQEGSFDAEQLLDIEKMVLGGHEGKAKRAAEAFTLISDLVAKSAEESKESNESAN